MAFGQPPVYPPQPVHLHNSRVPGFCSLLPLCKLERVGYCVGSCLQLIPGCLGMVGGETPWGYQRGAGEVVQHSTTGNPPPGCGLMFYTWQLLELTSLRCPFCTSHVPCSWRELHSCGLGTCQGRGEV